MSYIVPLDTDRPDTTAKSRHSKIGFIAVAIIGPMALRIATSPAPDQLVLDRKQAMAQCTMKPTAQRPAGGCGMYLAGLES